jgi:predicted AlkP superfamily pyrophosphatase or phosphodiesterase
MSLRYLALLALIPLQSSPLPRTGSPISPERPRLLLFLTVDQLRGDALARMRPRFGEGGFRLLLERGLWYADAHYDHATTVTGSGHATLVTGTGPSGHGVVGNEWFDVALGREVNCVEDRACRPLGEEGSQAQVGVSPRNLACSTIGDELVLASSGRSRVFSVSIKDRGAILPGGRMGKAFWYSSRTGSFLSSTYYYDALPDWAQAWNAAAHAERYAGASWELSRPREEYLQADQDDRREERPPTGMGRSFPHRLPDKPASLLRFTPFGDELTVDFALELLERERLGRGAGTDLLAISLSCTDYIGHCFGPDSLEAEDNLLRLDATLARLFAAVEQAVGLERTLVVLSSDHGVDSIPEIRHARTCSARAAEAGWLPRRGGGPWLRHEETELLCCDAGRLDSRRLLSQAEEAVRLALGAPEGERWVRAHPLPGIYLDHQAIGAAGFDPAQVARLLAVELRGTPGVAQVHTRAELLSGELPEDGASARLRRSFHPERSGDLLLTSASGWIFGAVAATHGSPWAHDTHVPILFAGAGVPAGGSVWRRVGPEDIAPTLAGLLGVEPPSASQGRVLEEVLAGR